MDRIVLKNITKKFNITGKKNQGFLANMISAFSSFREKNTVDVLRDVSLTVASGEILGVIGDNGNGKSTLLRVIAGIYQPDEGVVVIRGKIISLINLLVGLKDRLTMRENIFLMGSLFGMSQEEIKNKLEEIVTFSGFTDFINTKIYQFSNGMMQRLVFSIAVHANPDILLLDEVFEVGDEDFKEKSANKIKEIVEHGSCVILVSHDMEMINKYCDRVALMQRGRLITVGNPQEVTEKYAKSFKS